jgi:ABC-type polysaccharide/polyol phosphate transport system ATPase subunit
VIGHNGAGKSTLLRTIAGILPPSRGRVVVNGYVTTLLSVGIGFNGELTGRENIRLGGLANGLSPQDIARREHDIAEFSGLGEFVDYPLKTYSSGMRSRLGFSVAVHMEPEILLIDEALSAGDAAFRTKASEKIKEVMSKAQAILLVSHGLSTIEEMASSVLWLDHGRVLGHGDPSDTIEAYREHVSAGSSAAVNEEY